MNLELAKERITIVVAPVDMRSSYRKLSLLAKIALDIDVDAGGECVLFISKKRDVCKLIWADKRGTALLTRRLHHGRFEQFLVRADGPAVETLTRQDLMRFLDGTPTRVRRESVFLPKLGYRETGLLEDLAPTWGADEANKILAIAFHWMHTSSNSAYLFKSWVGGKLLPY